MILIEENFQGIITEAKKDTGRYFLRGVFAESEKPNRNGRQYLRSEMAREVEKINEQARLGRHVLGELDHPKELEIKLKNVSHRINRMWMEGDDAYGEAEILKNHPNGQILIGLIDEGIVPGVSTRGSGSVNKKGIVENFSMQTVDAVATPSARSAYPQTINEALELYRNGGLINEMAFELAHASENGGATLSLLSEEKTQKYFQNEMTKFINAMKYQRK